MNGAAALLLYAFVVLAAGAPLLRQLTADGAAPRLAIAAWLTATASVIGSVTAAMCLTVIEATGHWAHPDKLLATCLDRLLAILLGHGDLISEAAVTAAVTTAILLLAWMILRLGRSMRRMRNQTFAHAEAVRLVGKSAADDVVVVDTDDRAAYCVAGRPPAIVVTTAVLSALDGRQLAAVLAHERAHLDGRHAPFIAVLRSLAALFPYFALFTQGAASVAALLEMCADDVAARRHGRGPVLSGLLTLAGANLPTALGAANVAVVARAYRLAGHRGVLGQLCTRLGLLSTVWVFAAVPIGIAVLAYTGVLRCAA